MPKTPSEILQKECKATKTKGAIKVIEAVLDNLPLPFTMSQEQEVVWRRSEAKQRVDVIITALRLQQLIEEDNKPCTPPLPFTTSAENSSDEEPLSFDTCGEDSSDSDSDALDAIAALSAAKAAAVTDPLLLLDVPH